jgi:hypothetical protein
MSWVKCTRKIDNQTIYINLDTATSIRWNEADGFSVITVPGGKDAVIRVFERPEDLFTAAQKADTQLP